MKPLIICLFLFFSFSNKILSQGDLKVDFTNYTRKEGLTEDDLNSIVQDSRGFLWMGSREGLIRFDGNKFKTWFANPGDANSFDRNNVFVLGELANGDILFHTIYTYSINPFNKQIKKIESLKHKSYSSRPQEIHNKNWVFTDKDSLYICDKNLNIYKSKYLFDFLKPNDKLRTIACLEYPYLLIITINHQNTPILYNTITDDFKQMNFSFENNVKDINNVQYDSLNKHIYFSDYFQGLFHTEIDVKKSLQYKILKYENSFGSTRKIFNTPYGILQANEYCLSLYNKNRILSYDIKNDKLEKPPLPTPSDLIQTEPNKFWMTTAKGLSTFNLRPAVVQYIKKGLNISGTDVVKSITKGSDGNIYFITQEKGIQKLNKLNGSSTIIDNSVSYNWHIVSNKNTVIATGGNKKIAVYDIEKKYTTNPTYLQPFYGEADLVTLVFRSSKGDLWYSINSGQGLVLNPAGTNEYIHFCNKINPSIFSHRYVSVATEDTEGNIWFATNKNENLLKYITSQKKFEEININNLNLGITFRNGISYIYCDKKNNLWIAVDGMALIKFDLNKRASKYYGIKNGLVSEIITAITEDNSGRIWLNTAKGISCYQHETDGFRNFGVTDGFPEDKFLESALYFDANENLVYAGSEKSISWFNPDSLLSRTEKVTPKLYIDDIHVNGKPYYFKNNDDIQLASNQNNILFELAANDYERNNQLIFEYKLIGSSDKWIEVADNRIINFSNLPSGKYTLQVRTRHIGSLDWVSVSNPFTFTIATPWYKQWWFILLSIALTGFIIWFLIRQYYLRKLAIEKAEVERRKALEDERNRIARDMHDDIGSGLTKINYLSQMIMAQNNNDQNLYKIKNTANDLVSNMREIIWAIKEENNFLSELVLYIKNYTSNLCDENKLEYKITVPPDMSEKVVSGEKRRHIFMMIKEILHNTIKHANATEIKLKIETNDNLEIKISDNGKGLPDNFKKQLTSNGFNNIEKRVQILNAKMNRWTDNGLHYFFQIPL